MPKRGGKGPMKTANRGIAKANISLQSIASVLDQQSQQIQSIADNSNTVQDSNTIQNGGVRNKTQERLNEIIAEIIDLQKKSKIKLNKIKQNQSEKLKFGLN